MKSVFVGLTTLSLVACFPFADERDASQAEILSILSACGAKAARWEHQDQEPDRWVVTFERQGGDSGKRLACIREEEDKLGAGFTGVGWP
jgi:hypothetical protein